MANPSILLRPVSYTHLPAETVAPADVKIANSGRTVVDSGLVRTNIINEWTGNDADVIADKAAFARCV